MKESDYTRNDCKSIPLDIRKNDEKSKTKLWEKIV